MTAALLGAVLVGLSLGLLGSGGAILTVPILVYGLGHREKQAIAESMAIVGAISLVGAVRAFRRGRVDLRSFALFGVPGVLGTFLGALGAAYISGVVQLLLLGAVMLLASVVMWVYRPPKAPPQPSSSIGLPVAQGIGVGAVTGLVGVGGGFLIVPALVMLRGLQMKYATATSLAVISLNCAVGFLKYRQYVLAKDGSGLSWNVILLFVGLGLAGSVLGERLATRLHQRTLRRVFAVVTLLVAVGVLFEQGRRIL